MHAHVHSHSLLTDSNNPGHLQAPPIHFQENNQFKQNAHRDFSNHMSRILIYSYNLYIFVYIALRT